MDYLQIQRLLYFQFPSFQFNYKVCFQLQRFGMKTSLSSRGRSATQNTQSAKPNKPNITNKQNPPLQNINLNINIDGKKAKPKKQMPPKPLSKIEYNVEVNMTQSKIIEAKQGLQLLKRKMNRTGMSRQKNHSQSEKIDENLAQIHSNSNLKKNYNSQQNYLQKKANIPKQKQPPITSSRQLPKNITEKLVERKVNEFEDQRPISHNNNFMALLEKQMKKQQSLAKNPLMKVQVKKPTKILDENGAQVVLHQCSKGCGRMFNPQIISKHEKVCEKVFQSKRKEFNSAVHRQIQAENYKPPTINITKNDPKVQKKRSQIPKWKLQSAAFRAGLKIGKNQKLTKEQQKMMQMAQQDLVSCQFCGRKFNELASKKHVPFCEKKSKQSKMHAKKR